MSKVKPTKQDKSDCCNANVKVMGKTTKWFACTNCSAPCDLMGTGIKPQDKCPVDHTGYTSCSVCRWNVGATESKRMVGIMTEQELAQYHLDLKHKESKDPELDKAIEDADKLGFPAVAKLGRSVRDWHLTESKEPAHSSEGTISIHSPELNKAINEWSKQGRTEEQIYGVINFFTGRGRDWAALSPQTKPQESTKDPMPSSPDLEAIDKIFWPHPFSGEGKPTQVAISGRSGKVFVLNWHTFNLAIEALISDREQQAFERRHEDCITTVEAAVSDRVIEELEWMRERTQALLSGSDVLTQADSNLYVLLSHLDDRIKALRGE